jgi:hypothetical protein
MNFIGRHWLGLTVLSLFALTMVTMVQGPHRDFLVFDGLFALSFVVWALRGFIRFVGRAWHHSVTSQPRDAR